MYPTRKALLLWIFLCVSLCSLAQFEIIPNSNAKQLAQQLVGSGVTIRNIKLTGSTLSTAIFHDHNATRLGIQSGIVLSTGRVLTEGTHYGLDGRQKELASNKLMTAGDGSLNMLVNPKPTYDAVSLEFDFIPVGDTVKFRYAFSSEEYPTFTCSNFNDVFAFFISGPGISGTRNIALVPGTDIPVAINSINNGTAGSGYLFSDCQAMGPGSPFIQYFINNSGNESFTHNGHTTVLTASAAVQPCQVYHLKIAIADVDDLAYDSGVFLEAESLKSEPIRIVTATPMLGGKPYLAEGCASGTISFARSRKSSLPQVVNLEFGGSATNGTDVEELPSSLLIPAGDSVVSVTVKTISDRIAEGTETLKIYLSNGCDVGEQYLDSIQILVRDFDTLSITPPDAQVLCNGTKIQLIAAAGYDSYRWSSSGTLNDVNSRTPWVQAAGEFVCTAIRDECKARDSVQIRFKKLLLLEQKNITCLPTTQGGWAKVGRSSAWTQPAFYSLDNGRYDNRTQFDGLSPGRHVIRAKDESGCEDSVEVWIQAPAAPLDASVEVTDADCKGTSGKVQILATGGNAPYSYSFDGSPFSSTFNLATNGGDHAIKVRDASGCVVEKPILVPQDPPLTMTVKPSDLVCDGEKGLLFISATGGTGAYWYSSDGVHFQSTNSVPALAGSVEVIVKDSKNCEIRQQVIVPVSEKVFADAGRDTVICRGDAVQLGGNANADRFTWTDEEGRVLSNSLHPTFTPEKNATYFLQAVKSICLVTDTVRVQVRPSPLANAGADTTICFGRTIRLSGSGGSSYTWRPASLVSNPSSAFPEIRPERTTQYFLTVTDNFGCRSLKEDTVVVRTVQAIDGFAGNDTTIARGQSLQLMAIDRKGHPISRYLWTPQADLNDPSSATPIAHPGQQTKYEVILTTAEGCEGRSSVTIKVFEKADLYVSTGFSPNGDGKNDRLRPIPVGLRSIRYFKVVNRWGAVVFQTNSFQPGWDGTINGKEQPEGTYLWFAEIIDYNGNILHRQGTVSILR